MGHGGGSGVGHGGAAGWLMVGWGGGLGGGDNGRPPFSRHVALRLLYFLNYFKSFLWLVN